MFQQFKLKLSGTSYRNVYLKVQSSLNHLPPYIPPPSLNRHGFSFTKVQRSLYLMFNIILFYLPPLLSANIFTGPKGGG